MAVDTDPTDRLMSGLDQVERCLLLAETTAGVLESNLGVERESLISNLSRET